MLKNDPYIKQVSDINCSDFNEALIIYRESFPSNEKHPEDVITERIKNKKSLLFCLKLKGEVVGFSLIWDLKDSVFQLLDYFAIKQGFREKKLGSFFFIELINQIKSKNKRLIMEVEHPSFGLNTNDKKRRISFYLRNGSFILNNVPYILPPLDDTNYTEMLLLIAPGTENENISSVLIKDLIIRLYAELYNRDSNDHILNKFINKMPSIINLTSYHE